MTEEVVLDNGVESVSENELSNEKEVPVSEKMLPVSRVEELIKKAKLKGRDQMQAELEALKAENEALKKQGNPSMGGMQAPTVDVDAIKQQIMADFRNQMQQDNEKRAQEEMEKEAAKIAATYRARMEEGKKSFEDFDTVMADFNPAAFPNLVFLASQVDNTPAVMYELNKNPSKLATLVVLSERDPQAAQNMINRISTSIKANEQAKASERDVAPPLSRMSSSVTGQDTGEPSIRDFKSKYRG